MLGNADCTPAIDSRIGAILSFALSAGPLTSNWTSTERRSAEIRPAFGCVIGETIAPTSGCPESICTIVATAAENSAS